MHDHEPWLQKLAVVFKVLAGIGAAIYILMFLGAAVLRLSYPFELEWLEGMGVDHVQRILDGHALYVAPTIEFVPSIYTPLYYYVSAGAALFFGNGYVTLRLVSLLATLGSLILIYTFVKRETSQHYYALLAAGLYAATYNLSGAYFDIARVDALFTFFLLLGLWTLRFARTNFGFVLSAFFVTLSFLTKQTALVAAVFLLIFGLITRRDKGWIFAGALAFFISLSVVILNLVHHGWFTFYIFEVPARHPFEPLQFLKFLPQDFFHPLPLAMLAGFLFMVMSWLKGAGMDFKYYLLTGLGCFTAAAAPRLKEGHFANDLIPAYAFLALLFGIALPALRTWGGELCAAQTPDYPGRDRVKQCFICLFFAVPFMQLAALYYGPQNLIPTAIDRAEGERLLRQIAQVPGEVWITHHGYLGAQAGKKAYAMCQPIADVLYANNPRVNKLLLDNIEENLRRRRFEAIVTDEDHFLQMGCRQDYFQSRLDYTDPNAFYPVVNYRTRPTFQFVPVRTFECP